MKIPGGGGSPRELMRRMQKLQEDLEAAEQELAGMRVEASAGGGAVSAVANGRGELIELRVAPEVVAAGDVEMLQDLVLAAVREALEKARQVQQDRMGELTGGLGLPGIL